MKQFLLFADPACCSSIRIRGDIACRGRIYLKNSSRHRMSGTTGCSYRKDSKLTPPRCFRKTKAKEIFQSGEIDSVVCWHAQSPEHIRQVHSAESPGWMWVYLENTAHLRMHLFGKRVWHRFERKYSGLAGQEQPVAHGLLPEKQARRSSDRLVPQIGIQKTSSRNASPVMSAMIPNLPNVYGCRAPSAAKPYSCCAITIRRKG